MIKFTNTVEIERHIDDVFAYLGDLENVPEWNWAVTATHKVSEGPVGVGTEYRQTRTVPRPGSEELRLTSFEPPSTIVIEGTLGPFAARIGYVLRGAGETTTVVNEIELRSPGIRGIAAPIVSGRIRSSVEDNLRVLKAVLEESHLAMM